LSPPNRPPSLPDSLPSTAAATLHDGSTHTAIDEGRYPEPEFGADYYEQEPEIPNVEPELPEDFEDGKFNLIL
jgi:hypothetical protein